MIPQTDEPKGWMDVILAMIISILVIVCCGSCRTIRETEYITQRDTLTQYVTQRDSIYLHDSVYHEVIRIEDTIFITNDRWHTQYRDRILHDSIYIHRIDTVQTVKVIERKQSIAEKARQWLGSFFIIAAIIIGGYIGIRWLLTKWLDR